jgi:hypothetical protein
MSTFADNDFQLYYVNDVNTRLLFDMSNLPSGNFIYLSLPPVSGNIKLAFANVANTFSEVQNLDDASAIDAMLKFTLVNAAASNPYIIRVSDTALGTTTLIGVPLTGFTRSRAQYLVDQDGDFVMFGHGADPPATGAMGRVNRTAQSAAIGATNLTDTTIPGYYLVHYTLADTSTQVGVATVQFQVNYTDDAGATNQTGAALSLTATGRDRNIMEVYLASGNITYQTNVTGVIGAGRYALRVRCEFLG